MYLFYFFFFFFSSRRRHTRCLSDWSSDVCSSDLKFSLSLRRVIGILMLLSVPSLQAALTTAFTYQGRLTDGVSLATGKYDFKFQLYNAVTGGDRKSVV